MSCDAAPTAAIFPGQGSSLLGAERAIAAEAGDLHERCCEMLGCDPLARASQSTRYAQPAIFLASVASWRRARDAGLAPAAFAGHSLGEISALTAAGVWSEEQALELVVLRAALMADAGDASEGGMLALLRGSEADAEELARRFAVTVANENAPGQVVLSGSHAALQELGAEARRRGLRTIELAVSGAFHSPAMAPAREPFERAVRATAASAPAVPVYSCLTERPFADVARELAGALCAPVRWQATIRRMHADGLERFVDVGPDTVVSGLVRRIAPEASVLTIEEAVHARA